MTKSIKDIVFIGSGNVATHLALHLHRHYPVRQVFSRTSQSATMLAKTVDSEGITSPGKLDYSAGAYFLCLPDDQLVPLLDRLKFQNQLLIHTSGSVPMDVLRDFSTNYGVLYPVQTFSRNRPVNLSTVPLCIEADSPVNLERIHKLANRLSRNIHIINSAKRKTIHIAAVLACNFANHMYARAGKLMRDNQLDFDLLKPLILETAKKVMEMDPHEAQTGPAIRNDQKIIANHINSLRDDPELQKLYSFVSSSIVDFIRGD